MNHPSTHVRIPPDEQAAGWESVRQKAKQYVSDTGASAPVHNEIDQLVDRYRRGSVAPSGEQTPIQSKSATIDRHQILEYWLFDGLPLSTRIVFFLGVTERLFSVPENQRQRWDEFRNYMEEFHARETALRMSRDVGGWLFAGEPEAMWELGKQAASLPGQFCELGTWLGRSTLIWCHALKRFAPTKKLFVVDNWQWGSDGEKYPFMTEGRDTFLEFTQNLAGMEQCYRAHRGFIGDALPSIRSELGTEGLALLFHDAGHSYAEVKNDLTRYAPLLNDGAYLVVHDYNHPDFPGVREGVTAAQAELGYLSLEATIGTLGILRRSAS